MAGLELPYNIPVKNLGTVLPILHIYVATIYTFERLFGYGSDTNFERYSCFNGTINYKGSPPIAYDLSKLSTQFQELIENTVQNSKPQEYGNHFGTRWFKIMDQNKTGLKFTASDNFEFSAVPYTCHELELAYHGYELPRVTSTVINIHSKQAGIAGNDSWGSWTYEEYQVDSSKKQQLKFTIEKI